MINARMTVLRPVAAIGFLVCAQSVAAHANDGVHAMCLALDNDEVCSCASDSLRVEIGDEDYGIYEEIGADYMERLAAGEGRADAWTAASEVVAGRMGLSASALMKRTNAMGRAHRDAIKACGA